ALGLEPAAPALAPHLHLACGDEPAGANDALDVVLAQQPLDATRQLGHDLRFSRLHRLEIELDAAHVHAVRGEAVACALEVLARVQQRLARDAADVDARAAERGVALDAGRLE